MKWYLVISWIANIVFASVFAVTFIPEKDLLKIFLLAMFVFWIIQGIDRINDKLNKEEG